MTLASIPPESPLLTFAIPTYNRAECLDLLLGALLQQLRGESRVELIVSDNASTDKTSDLVDSYRSRGLALRYIRNEANIGADANFLQCLEQASGKYFWLFGDDDIVLPGGIQKILALLAADDYGLVYISAYPFRKDYLAERTSDKFGRYAEVLQDGLQLVQRVGPMITFMSSVIMNRQYYSSICHPELSNLIGTHLIQLGWINPILANSSNLLMVWERLVAGRSGNCAGWGPCQVFGVNLNQVSNGTLAGRKDIANQLCNLTLQGWFPGTIMDIRRGTGSRLDSENMREVLEPVYKKSWRYWTHVYPFIVLPMAMAELWYSIIRLTNRCRWIFRSVVNLVFFNGGLVKAPK